MATTVPLEATLVKIFMRWRFCSVDGNGSFEFLRPFVGGHSPTYRGIRTECWDGLKAKDEC